MRVLVGGIMFPQGPYEYNFGGCDQIKTMAQNVSYLVTVPT